MKLIFLLLSLLICLPLQAFAQSKLSDSDNPLFNSFKDLESKCLVLRQLKAQVRTYEQVYNHQEQLFIRSLTDKQLSLYSEFQESLIKSDSAKVALTDRKFQSSLNKKQLEQYNGLIEPLRQLIGTRQYFYQQAAEFEKDKSTWLVLAKASSGGDRNSEMLLDLLVQQKLTY